MAGQARAGQGQSLLAASGEIWSRRKAEFEEGGWTMPEEQGGAARKVPRLDTGLHTKQRGSENIHRKHLSFIP